ncbi:MAG: hypothetical protein KDK39_05010 [Leptospiraceae bacterium]|nr:hypothetical protein [Leptospiraceae bacterium]
MNAFGQSLAVAIDCPAKINLGLQVHHRRPADSYHYISSIFIPISFKDQIRVFASDRDQLRSIVDLPEPARADYALVSEHGDYQRNLLWRLLEATRAWRQAGPDQGRSACLGLEIHKNIPGGAGLGGGSSDAGRLLAWMRSYYDWPRQAVAELALQLGADVPFFLQKEPSLVYGIGELYEPVAVGPGFGILVWPGVTVNTAKAYQFLKRTLQNDPPLKSIRGLDTEALLALRESRWHQLTGLDNDFEEPVFALHPLLGRIKADLQGTGCDLAAMSGSGSSIFGLCATQHNRDVAIEAIARDYPEALVVPFEFPAG